MTLEEKIMLELKLKIINELIQERDKSGNSSIKFEFINKKEIECVNNLIEEGIISHENGIYFLEENIDGFIQESKLKLQLPLLPLDIDLESKTVLKQITRSSRSLAELKGISKTIPNSLILINALVLQEARDSSEIENIITTNDELYRAEINIGVSTYETKKVQNYAMALKIGFNMIKEKKRLSIDSIIEIQKVLEKNKEKQGIRKKFGTLIMNQNTKEILHVPPQDYNTINLLLSNLEEYIESSGDEDFLIKLAVIHHRFEFIHPFPDGNGRTGRILNVLYLVLKDLLDLPILYLSNYFIKNKTKYYELLKKVDIENQWEEWILFFLTGIEETSIEAVQLINQIKLLMDETKKEIIDKKPKIYSKELLELLFTHPYTKISFIVDSLGKDRKTASNILKELVSIDLLKEFKLGKAKYFVNDKLYKILKNR